MSLARGTEGWTIRKVMGGGGVGDFQFAGIFFFLFCFFFCSVLVQDFVFQLIPSARIFFVVVVFQKKKL